ncbi:hypothetical protein CSKR_200994, partial [Clonorchis sinensis]
MQLGGLRFNSLSPIFLQADGKMLHCQDRIFEIVSGEKPSEVSLAALRYTQNMVATLKNVVSK